MESYGLEHIIKGLREFAVAIMNQELKSNIIFLKLPYELPGLLGDPD